MPNQDEMKSLGMLAVQRGYISTEQLKEALDQFETAKERGSALPFGEFLVQEDWLGRNQLETLLADQGKDKTRELIPGYDFIKKLGEGAKIGRASCRERVCHGGGVSGTSDIHGSSGGHKGLVPKTLQRQDIPRSIYA